MCIRDRYILAQKHRQFAIKSEKFTPNQVSLFDEAQLPKNSEKIISAEEEIQVASYARKKNCGRKPLPKELPRVQHIYDLNENEKSCNCGCPLTYISDEKSEQLEIIPPKVYVIDKDKYFTEKYDIRLNIIKPLLDSLHHYLITVLPSISPRSLLGKAVSYTLNQWSKLTNHLKDGRLENNNNRSERAIKPFVIGRKGWLFANSVEGAHAAARIFSLIETCKYHEIEPYYYFKYILNKLPKCTTLAEFEALLPYNIDKKSYSPINARGGKITAYA